MAADEREEKLIERERSVKYLRKMIEMTLVSLGIACNERDRLKHAERTLRVRIDGARGALERCGCLATVAGKTCRQKGFRDRCSICLALAYLNEEHTSRAPAEEVQKAMAT